VIEVLAAGPLTTVQDAGRHGWRWLGVPVAGPADWFSHTVANRLVGNADGAAALEVTLAGPTLRFEVPATVAVVGAVATLGGVAVPSGAAFPVPALCPLAIGRTTPGARGYLAVAGGFEVPPVLGSRSTDTLAGLGPAPLAAGDRLAIGRWPGGGEPGRSGSGGGQRPAGGQVDRPFGQESGTPQSGAGAAAGSGSAGQVDRPFGQESGTPQSGAGAAVGSGSAGQVDRPFGQESGMPQSGAGAAVGSGSAGQVDRPFGQESGTPQSGAGAAAGSGSAGQVDRPFGQESGTPQSGAGAAAGSGSAGQVDRPFGQESGPPLRRNPDDGPLRVVPGPHAEWFGPAALRTLCGSPFTVTPASDRVGIRLAGPALDRAGGAELPVTGMVAGALQVPPDGQPILLLANHGPTGGYPVLAVVVTADLPAAGQARPGQTLRFRPVSREEAVAAYTALRAALDAAVPGRGQGAARLR
jgi:allophanate hydrolase subunit 2